MSALSRLGDRLQPAEKAATTDVDTTGDMSFQFADLRAFQVDESPCFSVEINVLLLDLS